MTNYGGALMYITKVFKGNDYILYSGEDVDVATITSNSKERKYRSIFFALKGQKNNAVEFVDEAIENGAVAIVSKTYISDQRKGIAYIQTDDVQKLMAAAAKRIYREYMHGIRLVAVTGTNGKTSFVNAAYQMYNNLNKKSSFTGTLGTNIKNCNIILPNNTTYDQSVYYELIRCANTDEIKNIFSEISSQGLALGRCEGIDFDVAVFLNLSQDHLDYHVNMENYYAAKRKLFDSCRGLLIINIDDQYGARLYREQKAKGKNIISYSVNTNADYMIQNIVSGAQSTSFELISKTGRDFYTLPLCGGYQALNITPIIILMLKDGFTSSQIKAAMTKIKTAAGRMECVYDGKPSVYIDYAHTPDALVKALSFLKSAFGNNITCVIGCGGDRDNKKRSLMGKNASDLADYVIFTNDNPRGERSAKILSEIINPIEKENYIVIPQREKAIVYALKNTDKNGVVLIAGKGHENYQISKGKYEYFSDKDTVNNYFNETSRA